MNDDSTAYMRHIAGKSKFIYYRGPARHKAPFELALLESMRGPITALALITRTPCFLDDPGWRSIPCCHSGNVDEISVGRGKDCLAWLFGKLPGTLRDLEHYLISSRARWKYSGETEDTAISIATMRDELLSRVLKLYEDLRDLGKYYETVLATLPDGQDEALQLPGKGPLLVVEKDLPTKAMRFLEDHRASIQILTILATRKLLGQPGILQLSPNLPQTMALECDRLRDDLLESNLKVESFDTHCHQHGPDFMRMGQNFTLRVAYAVVPRDDYETRESVRRKLGLS